MFPPWMLNSGGETSQVLATELASWLPVPKQILPHMDTSWLAAKKIILGWASPFLIVWMYGLSLHKLIRVWRGYEGGERGGWEIRSRWQDGLLWHGMLWGVHVSQIRIIGFFVVTEADFMWITRSWSLWSIQAFVKTQAHLDRNWAQILATWPLWWAEMFETVQTLFIKWYIYVRRNHSSRLYICVHSCTLL